MSVVNYKLNGAIGVISINNPPVNVLSLAVRTGVQEAIIAAQNDESKAIVLICDGRTFIAGADITEFGKTPLSPSLSDLLVLIECSSKPLIAALHGTALGGGLETALACHYRCALSSVKVGLPEVKLGLLPGAGGTQRVPRLAGVEAALDFITSGSSMNATKALSSGLIDKIIDSDLLSGAIEFAHTIVAEGAVLRKVSEMTIDISEVGKDIFTNTRTKLSRLMRGQEAPQHIVSCIEAAVNLPFNEGLLFEREMFEKCRHLPQSKALRHAFFAQRECAKVKGLSKKTPTRAINSVAIIGAGTMGSGIGMNFVNADIPVTLLELSEEALQRGKSIIAKNYAMSVNKGKLTQEQSIKRQQLISTTTKYADLADADMVIEAVFENLTIKKKVFEELDSVCKPGAILATNTSYQDVDVIAAATSRPQDVIGLHFFSPANIMKLLEIVRGEKTASDVLATVMSLAKKIGKVPVLSRVCYGFIGNRMLGPYIRQAQLCLIEGSTPSQIDKVMFDFGMAMGPLAVGDLAGLDIGYKARQTLTDEQKGDPKTYCIADRLVEMERLGQKSGAGYYSYNVDTRERNEDPLVQQIVEEEALKYGVQRQVLSDDLILNRLIFALINEGFKILEEGIAQRPSDVDMVYLFGYGFPAYRGGPMFYAETLGLDKVYQTICHFEECYGEQYWTPSSLLKTLAITGKSLAQWTREQC